MVRKRDPAASVPAAAWSLSFSAPDDHNFRTALERSAGHAQPNAGTAANLR